jgi:hypothetical protein
MKSNRSNPKRQSLPALIAGICFSAVGLFFNTSYGWALGGGNTMRALGMALVFVGCIALKDWMPGQVVVACQRRRYGYAALCAVGFILGAAGSFMAAMGAASDGRNEKSDPARAQITAFETAKKIEADAEKRLSELGTVPAVGDAKAQTTGSNVDPGIWKRTKGCTFFSTEAGKRVQTANSEACEPVVTALANLSKAQEAAELRSKRDEARAIISKGAPKAADGLVTNMSAFMGGEANAEMVLALIVAVLVEVGAPIAWAVYVSFGTSSKGTFGVPNTQESVPNGPEPKPGTSKPRSETQVKANMIAAEMRARGEVPKFHVVRNEFHRRFGTELPKVTAHRACA